MVSKRRLPPANGNGHAAKAVVPALKEGDRVCRLGGNPHGIIREVKKDKALIWWGTADNREVTAWELKIELELDTEPVISPDEVIKRQACGNG